MTKILVTWYGITDLRAALGQVGSGPVLDALKSGGYDVAIVLCYTDPCKTQPKSPLVQLVDVREVSNTHSAHTFFKERLVTSLREAGISLQIRTYAVVLNNINDTQGIFKAASHALKTARDDYPDPQIDVYLSPGTAAMAFTWGMASLVGRKDGIRAIASSDPTRPPVPVEFPEDISRSDAWITAPTIIDNMDRFDIIYHLFGEQRIPSGIVLREFDCPNHVFVTDKKFQSDVMCKLLPPGGRKDDLFIDPFDPKSVEIGIMEHARRQKPGSKLGFNLTGGTKLMYTGGLAAAMRLGGIPFYLDGSHQTIVRIDTWESRPYSGLKNVDDYITLAGKVVINSGLGRDAIERERYRRLAVSLWPLRSKLVSLGMTAIHSRRYPSEFTARRSNVVLDIRKFDDENYRISVNGETAEFCTKADFRSYVTGRWFEEYVFGLVSSIDGVDARTSLTVQDPLSKGIFEQEFDVIATDGKRILIIECKSGQVTVDDVYKLKNNIRTYGGVEAHGVLASVFAPSDPVRKRINDDRQLSLVFGDNLPTALASVLQSL